MATRIPVRFPTFTTPALAAMLTDAAPTLHDYEFACYWVNALACAAYALAAELAEVAEGAPLRKPDPDEPTLASCLAMLLGDADAAWAWLADQSYDHAAFVRAAGLYSHGNDNETTAADCIPMGT
jgi:hypothetical protein